MFNKFHLIPSTFKTEKAEPTPEYISLAVNPVKNIPEDGQRTQEREIRGVKWQILAVKQTIEKNDFFNVYLYANEKDIADKAFKVTCSFQLISRGSEQPESKKFKEVIFSKKMLNWGFPDFMEWDEFTYEKKEIVVHDTALLEAEVIIEQIK